MGKRKMRPPLRDFEVFIERSKGEPLLQIGSVRAYTERMALLRAKEVYTRRERCVRLVVVARDAMASTPPEDEQLFALTQDKWYRTPRFFVSDGRDRGRPGKGDG